MSDSRLRAEEARKNSLNFFKELTISDGSDLRHKMLYKILKNKLTLHVCIHTAVITA